MKLGDACRNGFAIVLLSAMTVGCSDGNLPSAVETSSAEPEKTQSASDKNSKPAQKIIEVFDVGADIYVRSLAVDEASNSLWVGTSLGVHEVNLSDHTIKNTFSRKDGLANEYIFSIEIDQDGYKWFGTNSGGVSRYKDGAWKTFFPMHGLADYWVYCFANAPDGGLWIGTWAGANYLDRQTEQFKTYVKELINEWVYGLAIDRKGQVWFGTEGGVSRFDGKEWRHWLHQDGLGAKNQDDLPFSKNTGLGTRSRHDLGILNGGKSTYNPNYVFSIMVDQNGNDVWAGTWGGGVSHLVDDKWHNLTREDGLAGDIVYSLAQDHDGHYWFGTNRGLSRYDGTNWVNYSSHDGLPGNNVYDIAVAPNGDIWVATRGGVTLLGYGQSPTGSATN